MTLTIPFLSASPRVRSPPSTSRETESETREKFAAGSEEFARKLRESQAETKEKFLATGEELARKMRESQAESRGRWDSFCQMLDRYL